MSGMIHVEQLVYGTFPFTQGFTLVSKSEGIDGALTQEAVSVCKSWGEVGRPEFRSAIYHVAVPACDNVHLVGRVTRQGTDRGARMAWYQQVLLVSREDYLLAGADCFSFDKAGFFKEKWFESDRCQALDVDPAMIPAPAAEIPADHRTLLDQIVPALERGDEVRFQAAHHARLIVQLIREALTLVALERRESLAVATFAFRPVRRYDLWCAYDPAAGTPDRVEDVSVRIGSSSSAQ